MKTLSPATFASNVCFLAEAIDDEKKGDLWEMIVDQVRAEYWRDYERATWGRGA